MLDTVLMDPVLSLAVEQGGIVTRGQALGKGMSERQIKYRVATGKWVAVISGIYQVLPMMNWEDRIRAAVTGLPDATASHEAAAKVHSFPGFQGAGIVVSVHTNTTHRWPGATVRRTSDLEPVDRVEIGGILCTTPTRTIVDLARVLSLERFYELADTLVSTGRINAGRVARVAARVCRQGKPGSTAVQEYVKARLDLPAPSVLEVHALELLRDAGLEGYREFPIPWSSSQRFDIAFPDSRLAVELDSRAWHQPLERFQSDRTRDREAALHGWLVVRFTWADIEARPNDFVATVAKLCVDRSRRLG